MTRNFSVEWNDLKPESQESILESCIEALTALYQQDGEQSLKKTWNNPQPKSWQEAYCRESAIEWRMWSDYEKGVVDAEEPSQEDWEDWVNEEIREKAEKACYKAMHHLEVSVEI